MSFPNLSILSRGFMVCFRSLFDCLLFPAFTMRLLTRPGGRLTTVRSLVDTATLPQGCAIEEDDCVIRCVGGGMV